VKRFPGAVDDFDKPIGVPFGDISPLVSTLFGRSNLKHSRSHYKRDEDIFKMSKVAASTSARAAAENQARSAGCRPPPPEHLPAHQACGRSPRWSRQLARNFYGEGCRGGATFSHRSGPPVPPPVPPGEGLSRH
jgi:hypothetical protein